MSEYYKKWYRNNREAKIAYQLERQRDMRRQIDKYKVEHGCDECGYNRSPRALQFHHVDPTQKIGNISRMVTQCRRLELIMDEISKCRILCANCHAEEEERLFIETSDNG